MYFDIQELKKIKLNISQIARHVGISRNTVYKYINMTPEEFQRYLERRETKKKKLDPYRDEILGRLKKYPDISAAQIYDWLKEKYPEIDVSERTVGNLVNQLRRSMP